MSSGSKRSEKKRVEFSSPIRMEGPSPPSGGGAAAGIHTWDTETDHMLSYFLGGGGSAGGITEASFTMPADFTTIHSQHHHEQDDETEDGKYNNKYNRDGDAIMEGKDPEGKLKHSDNEEQEEDDDDDIFVPPPTPLAPQFYHKKTSTAESKSPASDASVRAMAQTLITGGPIIQNLATRGGSSMSLNSLSSSASAQHQQSPLSPALMISTQSQSPENLLFPPESVTSAAQHRAWLQELNARAMAARQQQQAMPPPAPHHQHQPFGYPPTHPVSNGSAYLSTAAPSPHMWMIQQQQQQHHEQHLSSHHHPQTVSAAAAAAALSPAESEEKRAKRLERNRESARKSRRKKKERLESLEAKVQGLKSKIAEERLVQMAGMVGGLQTRRRDVRERFDDVEAPRIAIRESGPRSSIFQAVVDFSYTALKLNLLPPYQKIWLWITQQPESFFMAGKLCYVQNRENVSMGRISSKQVGEEWSKESGPPLQRLVDEDGNTMVPKNTSYCLDVVRFWPLVCYEHQFSVDQEERFLALHKRFGSEQDQSWTQAIESVRAVSSLSQAMTSVCGMASQREERTWVGILRPGQASRFQRWLTKERLDALRPPDTQSPEEASLSDICRRLEQVAISKATDR